MYLITSTTSIESNPIEEKVKQDTPTLYFIHNGIKFSVEFDNRSDYMACRDSGVDVGVVIVSEKRSKRVKGYIRRLS